MPCPSAKLHLALLCGGPSAEKGISLNSARSVMDHLRTENVSILPVYFDSSKQAYHISRAQLYSNTPADFDFKLRREGSPLGREGLEKLLRSCDLAFPAMHGPFGEDGELQEILEEMGVPFVGSGSDCCKRAFDKFQASRELDGAGFHTLPSILLESSENNHRVRIEEFFEAQKMERAVVKPARGGSSIGVFSVSTPSQALERARFLFSRGLDYRVVVEPFAEGAEFTMMVIEGGDGSPVALPPTRIETDYTNHQIFDFRKKYLPTRQVKWHCPPSFGKETTESIQEQGERIFSLFGMRDFARLDGWVLRSGGIWFCDINPVSGMEQNSFLFQQASRVGMTHADIFAHIVARACTKHGIPFSFPCRWTGEGKKRVNIIMGGGNSERQVSLMSGTNAWLKLRSSEKYEPRPFLLSPRGDVWQLPYHLCLNHTVEEIVENCERYEKSRERAEELEQRFRSRLGLASAKDEREFFAPSRMSMKEFLDNSPFVFLALHGGRGEDGTLQRELEDKGIGFNGPGSDVSRLCMDKWETARFVQEAGIEGVSPIPGKRIKSEEVLEAEEREVESLWEEARQEFGTETLIVKPAADGCSSGIVHLYSASDLFRYAGLLRQKAPFIPPHTFRNQPSSVEMPTETPESLILEKFVRTDALEVKDNKLYHRERTGWIESTVGVLQEGEGIRALNPSITVVESDVLTVEEKFQGGTGVNITPPPPELVSPSAVREAKTRIEKLAERMGIEGYSRVDIFLQRRSGEVLVIEVNTLPALTPSTVLYHQALAQDPPVFPAELLERIIRNSGY